MKKEFVMRGQTASDLQEVLNFSGYKPGYAYRLVEFQLWPSATGGSGDTFELAGSVTAAKTYENPANPNFNNEGLIATAFMQDDANPAYPITHASIVNDTFLITQNLILAVIDTQSGTPQAVNWQCRFVSEKMTGPEEAATNYKQYAISDE